MESTYMLIPLLASWPTRAKTPDSGKLTPTLIGALDEVCARKIPGAAIMPAVPAVNFKNDRRSRWLMLPSLRFVRCALRQKPPVHCASGAAAREAASRAAAPEAQCTGGFCRRAQRTNRREGSMSHRDRRSFLKFTAGTAGMIAAPGILRAQTSSSAPIKVGVNLPLSGVFALVGQEANKGINMYVDSINKTAAGRKLEVFFEDETVQVNTAVTKARKLLESDRVHALLGGAST